MTITLTFTALTVQGLGVLVSLPLWLVVTAIAASAIAYRRQTVRTRQAMRKRQAMRQAAITARVGA